MYKGKGLFLLLAMLLVFAAACQDPGTDPNETYDISGTVTVEGTPLEGVTITIDDGTSTISKVTDAQGQWSAEGLTKQTIVTASKDGYSINQQYEVDTTSQLPFNAIPDQTSQPILDWVKVDEHSAEARIYDVAWSPNGQSLAFSTQLRVVSVVDVETGNTQVLDDNKTSIPAVDTLAWSHDGRMLALSGWYPEVLIWNLSDENPVLTELQVGLFQGTKYLAWSPGSSKFAVSFTATVDGETVRQLEIWDGATGQKLQDIPGTGYGKLAWSPDGNYLASTMPGHRLEVLNTSDWSLHGTLADLDFGMAEIAWSPDGLSLALADGRGILIFSTETMTETGRLQVGTTNVAGLSWSPCGKYLAGSATSNSFTIWDVEGQNEHQSGRVDRGNILTLDWSSTGYIALGDGESKVTLWHEE